eukprot:scaffold574_cov376-Prasinococcus_capsulatus_cf.AAC.4
MMLRYSVHTCSHHLACMPEAAPGTRGLPVTEGRHWSCCAFASQTRLYTGPTDYTLTELREEERTLHMRGTAVGYAGSKAALSLFPSTHA